MTRPAKIQMIGPFAVLVMICGAEVSAVALAQWPASEILWRANLEWFHAFQITSPFFAAYPAWWLSSPVIGCSLCSLGLWGLACHRPLPLAISCNLSFLYAAFSYCGGYLVDGTWPSLSVLNASSGAEFAICVSLVAVSFLSAATSHIHYFRAIGAGL